MADDVKDLQDALMLCGFSPGKVDGLMGPGTKEAIRKFQRANGLGADGIAGPNTRAALTKGLGAAAARATELVTKISMTIRG